MNSNIAPKNYLGTLVFAIHIQTIFVKTRGYDLTSQFKDIISTAEFILTPYRPSSEVNIFNNPSNSPIEKEDVAVSLFRGAW